MLGARSEVGVAEEALEFRGGGADLIGVLGALEFFEDLFDARVGGEEAKAVVEDNGGAGVALGGDGLAGSVDEHDAARDAGAMLFEQRRREAGEEDEIAAEVGEGVGAADGFFGVAERPVGVGAADDEEVLVGSGVERAFEAREDFVEAEELLRDVGVLAEGVVFDVDGGDARVFERPYRSPDVGGMMEAAFGVGQHRDVDGVRNGLRLGDELVQGEEPYVGQAETARRGSIAADVDGREARGFDELRRERVVGAGNGERLARVDQFP